MMNRIMFRERGEKGFTLIELLVVIAIIGILATIVLASLNSARLRSRDAKRVADLRNLQSALELSYDSNSNEYPTNAEGIASLAPLYIPAAPLDPNGGGYGYRGYNTAANPRSYLLYVTLENTGHAAENSDLTGTIDTINCDAAGVYCVGP